MSIIHGLIYFPHARTLTAFFEPTTEVSSFAMRRMPFGRQFRNSSYGARCRRIKG
jgi:hypothetical protein